jgi:hypothetical protein
VPTIAVAANYSCETWTNGGATITLNSPVPIGNSLLVVVRDDWLNGGNYGGSPPTLTDNNGTPFSNEGATYLQDVYTYSAHWISATREEITSFSIPSGFGAPSGNDVTYVEVDGPVVFDAALEITDGSGATTTMDFDVATQPSVGIAVCWFDSDTTATTRSPTGTGMLLGRNGASGNIGAAIVEIGSTGSPVAVPFDGDVSHQPHVAYTWYTDPGLTTPFTFPLGSTIDRDFGLMGAAVDVTLSESVASGNSILVGWSCYDSTGVGTSTPAPVITDNQGNTYEEIARHGHPTFQTAQGFYLARDVTGPVTTVSVAGETGVMHRLLPVPLHGDVELDATWLWNSEDDGLGWSTLINTIPFTALSGGGVAALLVEATGEFTGWGFDHASAINPAGGNTWDGMTAREIPLPLDPGNLPMSPVPSSDTWAGVAVIPAAPVGGAPPEITELGFFSTHELIADGPFPDADVGPFTPTANALLVAVCPSGDDGLDALDPQITDTAGLTWTRRVFDQMGGYQQQMSIWTAQVGESPSSMTVSVSNAESLYGVRFTVYEVTGHDQANPIGLTAVDIEPASPTLSLGGTTQANSLVLGVALTSNTTTAGIVGGAGDYTDLLAPVQIAGGSNRVHQHQTATGAQTSVDWTTISWDTYGGAMLGAIEILAGAGGGGEPEPTDYPSDYTSAAVASDTYSGVVTLGPQSLAGDITVSARASDGAAGAQDGLADASDGARADGAAGALVDGLAASPIAARATDSADRTWAGVGAALAAARAALATSVQTASSRTAEPGAGRAGATASGVGAGGLVVEASTVQVAGTAGAGQDSFLTAIALARADDVTGGNIEGGVSDISGTVTITARASDTAGAVQASEASASVSARADDTASSVQDSSVTAAAGSAAADERAFIGSAIPLSMESIARAVDSAAITQYDGAPDIRDRVSVTASSSIRTDALGTTVIDSIQTSGVTVADGAVVSFSVGGVNSAQRLEVTGTIEVESRTIRLHIESLTPIRGIKRMDT